MLAWKSQAYHLAVKALLKTRTKRFAAMAPRQQEKKTAMKMSNKVLLTRSFLTLASPQLLKLKTTAPAGTSRTAHGATSASSAVEWENRTGSAQVSATSASSRSTTCS